MGVVKAILGFDLVHPWIHDCGHGCNMENLIVIEVGECCVNIPRSPSTPSEIFPCHPALVD
jgi:hypothetical protein